MDEKQKKKFKIRKKKIELKSRKRGKKFYLKKKKNAF
jgi:hypothetical protein